MFKQVQCDKLDMSKGNRMVRAGIGQHNGVWFARVDLWWVGFRLSIQEKAGS